MYIIACFSEILGKELQNPFTFLHMRIAQAQAIDPPSWERLPEAEGVAIYLSALRNREKKKSQTSKVDLYSCDVLNEGMHSGLL